MVIDSAIPPELMISLAVFSPAESFMSATITLAPSAANLFAITNPMPLPAPVTMTTFPINRYMSKTLTTWK